MRWRKPSGRCRCSCLPRPLQAPVPEDLSAERRTGHAHRHHEQIGSFIDAHYREDISMQDAAAALRYSDAYFCKLFKQCLR